MSVRIFLDTNILLYQFGEDEDKRVQAIDILDQAVRSDNYVISYQVIQEFSNVALSEKKKYFSVPELKSYLQDILIPLCKFYPSADFYLEGLRIKNKYKYGFYDSLILAAAKRLGCTQIYSEDLQTGQKLEGLQIINPFKVGSKKK
ncbi:PIN domain-containing protein [Leptospira koniambonensis]|uniref:PIN domain-containing protein n=1 Tax=Leptospira koniambonensis TaxID=2484950 RepID=UPI003EBCE9F3